MSVEMILEQAGIPLLLFVICVYYGVRLLVLKDAEAIQGKNRGPLKKPEEYAVGAGWLLLFFAGATLLMAILLFINIYAAVVQIAVCTIILGVLWKRLNDKYGE